MNGKKNESDISQFSLFIFFVMFITGIGLTLYCFFIQEHPLNVGPQSSPIFYFILGFIFLVVKICKDKEKELKEGKAPYLLIFLFFLLILTALIYWKFIFSYMS